MNKVLFDNGLPVHFKVYKCSFVCKTKKVIEKFDTSWYSKKVLKSIRVFLLSK